MIKLDFLNDPSFGPFGVISRKHYDALPPELRKAIDGQQYERIHLKLQSYVEALDEFMKVSETVNIMVNSREAA